MLDIWLLRSDRLYPLPFCPAIGGLGPLPPPLVYVGGAHDSLNRATTVRTSKQAANASSVVWLQHNSWISLVVICFVSDVHQRMLWTIYSHLLGTVSVWELEDIHTSCRNILLIFITNLFVSVAYTALSSEIPGFWFLYFVLYVILTLLFMFIILCAAVASN